MSLWSGEPNDLYSVLWSATDLLYSAGVAGLTTALLLASAENPSYNVTIIAKDVPGDEDPYYTSPWAGANYLP